MLCLGTWSQDCCHKAWGSAVVSPVFSFLSFFPLLHRYPASSLPSAFFFLSPLFLFFFPMAYRGSQVRGLSGAVATGLHHSHNNARLEPRLWPTYTTAHGNARSLTHWARPGIEPATSRFPVGFVSTVPQQELLSSPFHPSSIKFPALGLIPPLLSPVVLEALHFPVFLCLYPFPNTPHCGKTS